MKGSLNLIFLSLSWLSCLWGFHAWAQEPIHTQLQDQVRNQLTDGIHDLVDFIDLALETPGGEDTLCNIKFREEWQILPEQHSISKEVLAHDSSCIDLLMDFPERNGSISLQNLSYEFHLLDPHLVLSGNIAFPEPDSMDLPTRRLQGDLIALISELSDAEKRYRLEDQLLSVIFYEDWFIDPHSRRITKMVRGISPVIWQRRKTIAGEPVNDGDTGLPVYYKIELERIDLRNP